MTPEIAKQLGLADERGVVVTSVQSGSLADQAGISQGDLVIAVENHPIHSVADFQAAFRDRDLSRGVRLQLKRESVKRFVFLRGSA
jgi:serine protease Do